MTTCVILQPSYIPWRGYFDQIRRADVFVFYDDVQYDRRGWRNRNKIKTASGAKWLTIPVLAKGNQAEHTPINEIQVCWDRDWASTHWASLRHAYADAPYFGAYAPMLEGFYARRPTLLADFTIETTVALARELGISATRFLRSSALGATGAKTDRLLRVLEAVGATRYISGPSARDYIEADKFERAGIPVEYMNYDYPQYEQLHPPYEPAVSIVDLLVMKGPSAGDFIWGSARGE